MGTDHDERPSSSSAQAVLIGIVAVTLAMVVAFVLRPQRTVSTQRTGVNGLPLMTSALGASHSYLATVGRGAYDLAIDPTDAKPFAYQVAINPVSGDVGDPKELRRTIERDRAGGPTTTPSTTVEFVDVRGTTMEVWTYMQPVREPGLRETFRRAHWVEADMIGVAYVHERRPLSELVNVVASLQRTDRTAFEAQFPSDTVPDANPPAAHQRAMPRLWTRQAAITLWTASGYWINTPDHVRVGVPSGHTATDEIAEARTQRNVTPRQVRGHEAFVIDGDGEDGIVLLVWQEGDAIVSIQTALGSVDATVESVNEMTDPGATAWRDFVLRQILGDAPED